VKRAAAMALALVPALALACARREVAPPAPAPASGVDAGEPARAAPVPLPADLEPDTASYDRADAGTATIKLLADPRRQARVFWGRKDLGVAPLEIVRPRGSAPLDLLIQAPDCLPLHTRVFTDRDDVLSLRLYSEREAAGLPGYSPPAAPPTGAIKTRRQF
jgi:hypothetical protein